MVNWLLPIKTSFANFRVRFEVFFYSIPHDQPNCRVCYIKGNITVKIVENVRLGISWKKNARIGTKKRTTVTSNLRKVKKKKRFENPTVVNGYKYLKNCQDIKKIVLIREWCIKNVLLMFTVSSTIIN